MISVKNVIESYNAESLGKMEVFQQFEAGPDNQSNHSPIQLTTKLWLLDRPVLEKTEVIIVLLEASFCTVFGAKPVI